MTKSFRFQNFPVYKDIKNFIKDVFVVTSRFPAKCQFDLGGQVRRASISVLLNLAEGFGRNSDKEFNRFVSIAIGSVYEIIAGLDIALDNKLLKESDYSVLYQKAESIKSQLGGLSKVLKSRK